MWGFFPILSVTDHCLEFWVLWAIFYASFIITNDVIHIIYKEKACLKPHRKN